jgi:hypothetical protein
VEVAIKRILKDADEKIIYLSFRDDDSDDDLWHKSRG